jgi:hydrogenase maturation protease
MVEVQKEILILGIGNLLLKDEGVGVRVVKRLRDINLPCYTEVLDGGTLGLDLLFYIEGRKKVIVIDAVKAGGTPGTIYRFADSDIVAEAKISLSAHDIDFMDVLKTAHFLGHKPEIIFIGIEPKDISEGLELSPEIEKKIPKVIDVVMREIGRNKGKI